MRILDATAGFRGIWYQKNHPFVTFMDKREGKIRYTNGTKLKNQRTKKINPDVVSEWKDAPFPDDYFDMIIFDPPHIVTNSDNNLTRCYGKFDKSTYKQEIKQGVEKLFQILRPEGTFILKWCESSIKIEEILKLFPYKPMFGSNTRMKGFTQNYWILFIKHSLEEDILNYGGVSESEEEEDPLEP